MTRFFALISCLILVLGLCVGVSATENTRASSMNLFATVSDDGSSQISSTVTLHLDSPQEDLFYPIPGNATAITLNGSRVITRRDGDLRLVDLSKLLGNLTGDFSFTIGYTISAPLERLTAEATGENPNPVKRIRLELPLLSGFAYPVDQLQFSINLPGVVRQNPSFVSGYHQANIEKDLSYTISGGNIAGRATTDLKDHETLTMYLDATEEMFPQTRADLPPVEKLNLFIGITSGLALLFWLLFLRNYIPIRRHPAVAPEGIGAGQLGHVLTMNGTDLGLMIFSWAQLGYLVLRMDRRGRVILMKRMDMGNERSDFEQKCFYKVFARRDTVDTGSSAFQKLYRSVAVQRALSPLFRTKRPGMVRIFRILCALTGMFCGACFGILLGNMLDFGWLFMLVLAALGFVCSWQIQHWPHGIFLHHPFRFWLALGLCVLWLALGIAIGQFPLALLSVLIQSATGFLAAFGGRRTEEGRTAMAQTLSLRRHLRQLSVKQIQQLCRDNPEFFFDAAPYAIALGCDRTFARRFGKSRLPVCPYIQASDSRGLTAAQWAQLMRQLLEGMTVRQRRIPTDGFRAVMRNYMK